MSRPVLTRLRRERFLTLLAERGNVSYAARQAGLSRSRAYELRRDDMDFACAWDEALLESGDLLESEAVRRAVEGVEEPYYYQGEQRGTSRKYSDQLLMFLLKARNPERYGSAAGEDGETQSSQGVIFELHLGEQDCGAQEAQPNSARDVGSCPADNPKE